jgi:hypothetical protein
MRDIYGTSVQRYWCAVEVTYMCPPCVFVDQSCIIICTVQIYGYVQPTLHYNTYRANISPYAVAHDIHYCWFAVRLVFRRYLVTLHFRPISPYGGTHHHVPGSLNKNAQSQGNIEKVKR